MAGTSTISGRQCHREVDGTDRHDQAIGRIVRLMHMLPVKELDALADRLGQRLGSSWRTNRPSIADLRETDHYDEPVRGPVMAAAEPVIDMVGH
jgi:hypothetical protein